MTPDLALWIVGRSSGVACLVALGISILTGMAMRTGVLTWLAHNRGIRVLHDFTNWLWIPAGLVHVGALVLDRTSQVGLFDLVVPFGVPYGRLQIGLGTISLLLLIIVTLSTWARRWIPYPDWITLHRLAYIGFIALFAHSFLAGTDLADARLATLAWTAAVVLGLVGLARLASELTAP